MGKQFGHIARIWILNSFLITVLFAISLPISGCHPKQTIATITPFAGDYPILKLRQMWLICSNAFRQANPYVRPETVVKICDCYVDEMRETYARIELDALNQKQSKEMGNQLTLACNSQGKEI
jgi:hypothetical protein